MLEYFLMVCLSFIFFSGLIALSAYWITRFILWLDDKF